jgi:hypothetical protein
MTRITLKLIKAELEKFKTLNEKRQYLENIIKKTKSEKLKTRLQKLLAEVLKHIGHETELIKEISLEEKLGSAKEAKIDISSGFVPEIKYVPLPKTEISPLEKEVARQPFFGPSAATVGVKYAPPNFYEHQQRVESLKFYLSEQQQLVQKFTPDAWQAMPNEQKRHVKDFVRQSLGLSEISSIEADRIVKTYISDLFSTGKPSEKYKTRT